MSDSAHIAKPGPPGSSVADVARAGEPDRYLAALLSKPEQRTALLALAAFSAELSRIPGRVVHEPAMGEIRLQWWRDALDLPFGLRTGHPIAEVVRETAQAYQLPTDLLHELIDGQALRLRRGMPLADNELDDLLWKTEGALFALSARVVGLPVTTDLEAGCTACGQAYGLTRLLLGLPRALARGTLQVSTGQLEAAGLTAEDLLSGAADVRVKALLEGCSAQIGRSLADARVFAATLPRAARVAFLPLALVRSYLRALERSGESLAREEASLAPLTRVWRIAAAHLFGRL